MSDVVNEVPEEFSFPGPEVSGDQITIRVGVFNYLFEKQIDGGLRFKSRYPANIPDEVEDEPFDPSKYR